MNKSKIIWSLLLFLASSTGYSQCIEGDCENGFGIFKCSCGYIFEGEFKDGQKVFGTLTKEDLIYTGEFKYDVAEGQGKIKFIDSTWYEGSFVNNFPQGMGTFHFADGTTYTGEMFEGDFHGVGVMQYPANNEKVTVYKMGEFHNDDLNGFGIMIDSNSKIMGQFVNGSLNGFGVIIPDSGVVMGGKLKNRKVVKPFELEKDKELINYKSSPMRIGKEWYWMEGKFDGSEWVIVAENTDKTSLRVFYNPENNQLFVSSFEGYPKGKIIDLAGKIREAQIIYDSGKVQIIELEE